MKLNRIGRPLVNWSIQLVYHSLSHSTLTISLAVSFAFFTFVQRLTHCLADDQFSLIYSDFIKIVKYLLNSAIPSKTVSMSYRDPPFITPQIKVLLRKRNKLRRRGKIQEADVKK